MSEKVFVKNNQIYIPTSFLPRSRLKVSKIREGSFYRAPLTHRNLAWIESTEFPKDDRTLEQIEIMHQEMEFRKNNICKLAEGRQNPCDPYLIDNITLRPYQCEGAGAMANSDYALLNADCGLGKTMIILATILLTDQKFLVICPKSLIENTWVEELEDNTDLKYWNLRNKKGKEFIDPPEDTQVFLINYGHVNTRLKYLMHLKFDVLVLDESAAVKSSSSRISKQITKVRTKANKAFLLSGSPAPNGIRDLWQQYYILDGGASLSNNEKEFLRTTHSEYSMDVGSRRQKTISTWKQHQAGIEITRKRVAPTILRYRKSEVADDLPEKNFFEISYKMSDQQRRAYDNIRNDAVHFLETNEIVSAQNKLVEFGKLAMITGGFVTKDKKVKVGSEWKGELYQFPQNPKLDLLCDKVNEVSGSLIIWAWYKHEVEMIARKLNVPFIHGAVSDKKSNKIIRNFKKGDLKILVSNPQCLGEGQNFQIAHYMFFYSNSFNSLYRQQAVERIHRLTQKNDCFYYDFICKGAFDHKLLDILKQKKNVQDYVTSPLYFFE